MAGASTWRTLGRIVLPLSWFGLVAAWVIVFAQILPEVSAGVFLSGTTNPVVGPVILLVWQQGGIYPVLAALTLLVTLIQIAVVGTVLLVATRKVITFI
jgi:ABC-type spermidine/putrescine transport system permease subunit II